MKYIDVSSNDTLRAPLRCAAHLWKLSAEPEQVPASRGDPEQVHGVVEAAPEVHPAHAPQRGSVPVVLVDVILHHATPASAVQAIIRWDVRAVLVSLISEHPTHVLAGHHVQHVHARVYLTGSR